MPVALSNRHFLYSRFSGSNVFDSGKIEILKWKELHSGVHEQQQRIVCIKKPGFFTPAFNTL